MSNTDEQQVGGAHYKVGIAPKFQHWNLVLVHNWDYFQAQIIKYVMRHKYKGGIEDLLKAQHFLNKYLELQPPPTNRPVEEGAATPAYVDQARDADHKHRWAYCIKGDIRNSFIFECVDCTKQTTVHVQ